MKTPPSFPRDENGDVLRRMAEAGVDLVSRRVIDFEFCFPDEVSANGFTEAIRTSVMATIVYPPDPVNGEEWGVQCRERMVPSHSAISETERRLTTVAEQFGGYADGWGSLSNADGSPAE